MIAFLTFFLGIVTGPHQVELSAGPGVVRIELYVDGNKARDLVSPWTTTLDLGNEIAPQELVAVAYDRDGKRMGEARQWINRATSEAEAGFALERDGAGRVVAARLVWHCPSAPTPTSVVVALDGQTIEAKDSGRIPIPSRFSGSSHVLTADLTFAGGITATAVTGFGGTRLDDTGRQLTAVPVRLAAGSPLPKNEQMAGWFESGGKPLDVVAVEEGPPEVVFVLAGRVRKEFERLVSEDNWPWPWKRPQPIGLSKESRFRFMLTTPHVADGSRVVTFAFPVSEECTAETGRFLRLARDTFLDDLPTSPRIADAVATSALTATRRERRRAVVLLLAADAAEAGHLDAARVSRYLERLRVPLYVWRVSPAMPPAAPDWPGVVDASTVEKLGQAFQALRDDLDSQRIVWVEGRFVPSAVAVTAKAAGALVAR